MDFRIRGSGLFHLDDILYVRRVERGTAASTQNFLYCRGVIPVSRLKYLQKKLSAGK